MGLFFLSHLNLNFTGRADELDSLFCPFCLAWLDCYGSLHDSFLGVTFLLVCFANTLLLHRRLLPNLFFCVILLHLQILILDFCKIIILFLFISDSDGLARFLDFLDTCSSSASSGVSFSFWVLTLHNSELRIQIDSWLS